MTKLSSIKGRSTSVRNSCSRKMSSSYRASWFHSQQVRPSVDQTVRLVYTQKSHLLHHWIFQPSLWMKKKKLQRIAYLSLDFLLIPRNLRWFKFQSQSLKKKKIRNNIVTCLIFQVLLKTRLSLFQIFLNLEPEKFKNLTDCLSLRSKEHLLVQVACIKKSRTQTKPNLRLILFSQLSFRRTT